MRILVQMTCSSVACIGCGRLASLGLCAQSAAAFVIDQYGVLTRLHVRNRQPAPRAKPLPCRKQRSSGTRASCWASARHARCFSTPNAAGLC